MPGCSYGIVALATGAIMIVMACRVRGERQGHRASKQMFAFSILYLFLLFAMLLVDKMAAGLFGSGRHDRRLAMNDSKKPPPLPPSIRGWAGETGIRLTEQQLRARRARSIAIAVSLGLLVVLFYIVTLVKGPGVLDRPL